MFCPVCSASNFETALRCIRCGGNLLAPWKGHDAMSSEAPSATPAEASPSPTQPRLTAKNYLIAIGYLVFITAGYWWMYGGRDGALGALRVATFIVAFLITLGVIASMDSRSSGGPANRPFLRTFLAAAILGAVPLMFGGPWSVCVFLAIIGAVLGALGWSAVQNASL